MKTLIPIIKSYSIDILPAGERSGQFWLISLAAITISVILIATLGSFSLGLLFIIPLLYCLFKYSIFPLCFTLALLPFVMGYAYPYYLIFSVLASLFIIFTWIARVLLDPYEMAKFSKPLFIFSIIFLFLGLLSCLHKGATTPDIRALVRFCIFFPTIFAIYSLVKPKEMVPLIIAMTIPTVFAGFIVLKTYREAHGLIALLNLYRLKPGGLLPNANILGNLLTAVFPIWAAIGIWHRNRAVKIGALSVAALLAIFIIMSNSRAAIFGFMLAVTLFSWLAKKMKLLIVIIILVAVIMISFPDVRNLVFLGLRMERGTTSRDVIWKNTFNMIQNNFWLGIGLGNFPYEYDRYYKTSFERDFNKLMPNAHNLLIDMFARMGIMGLFLGVAIYYMPLKAGIKAYRKTITQEDRAMVYGILGSLIALYGWSFFEAGGILGDGRLYSDVIFWIMYIMLLKVNSMYKEPAGGIFFGAKTGQETV